MHRRVFIQFSGFAVVAISRSILKPTVYAEDTPPVSDLGDLLESIRKDNQLPGLAAAVVRGNELIAAGVAGVRQAGKAEKIGLNDRFLLGSCTKAMTVLMICRLVDAGKLTFDTTLGDALSDVKMRDDYRKVTLAQLLAFKGGLQPYTQIGPKLTPVLFENGAVAERRTRFVEHVLNEEPIVKPGTRMKYSNASYVVAAYIASKKTNADYESLVAEHVFKPLGMASAGFGSPRTVARPNEPSFHVQRKEGYVPVPDGARPAEAILAPAGGGSYCSIRDFAKFAAHQLAAAQGHDPLLKPTTAQRARKELGNEFPGEGGNFGGTPWLHAGFMLKLKKNYAIVVATNCGAGDETCEAVFKAVRERLALDK